MFDRYSFLFAVFFCFQSSLALATIPVLDDKPYKVQHHGGVKYIIAEDQIESLVPIKTYMDFFIEKYQESYQWRLDETLNFMLLSGQNQVPNGFATVTPFLETVHYTAGAPLMEGFAEESFIYALTSHETAHLYQLSAKKDLSKTVKFYLGNTPYFYFILPIFVFPNAFIPNSFHEGNAVLNESIWGRGGRLWSGEIRSEVYTQILNGKIGPARFFNSTLDFPLTDHYNYSGYFFSHLAEELSIAQANSFFINHSEHFLFPFKIKDSFKRTFGKSYERALFDFERKVRTQTKGIQLASGSILEISFINPILNHDENSIFALINPKGIGDSQSFEISKSNLKKKTETTKLPSGKLFRSQKGFVSAAYSTNSPDQIQFGLYDENLKSEQSDLNYFVTDQRVGHTLKFDTRASYLNNKLFKDHELIDIGASGALLDDQGEAYYFKQQDRNRVLYKSKTPLFQFEGHFSKLAEITSEGRVYFISNTKFGSALYFWEPSTKEIYKALPYDNIVDARRINDKTYLVVTLEPNGYALRKEFSASSKATPSQFSYAWENQNAAEKTELQKRMIEIEKSSSDGESHGPYHSLFDMKHSSTQLLFGLGFQVIGSFSDPLNYNQLLLSALIQDHLSDYNLYFKHLKSRFGFDLSSRLRNETIGTTLNGEDTFAKLQSHKIRAITPLWSNSRWQSRIAVGPLFEHEDDPRYVQKGWQPYLSTGLNLTYLRPGGPLNYRPHRFFGMNIETLSSYSKTESRFNHFEIDAELAATIDLYSETYLNVSSRAIESDENRTFLRLPENTLTPSFTEQHLQLTTNSDILGRKYYYSILSLEKPIAVELYSSRFPLSLRRIVPFYHFTNQSYLKTQLGDITSNQSGFGLNFDFVIFHIMSGQLAGSWSKDIAKTSFSNEGFKASLHLNSQF